MAALSSSFREHGAQVLGDHKGNVDLWLQYIELVSEAAAQRDGSALSIRAAYRTALQVGGASLLLDQGTAAG